MISHALRFIDRLFCETSIVTTVSKKKFYDDPDTIKSIREYCREHGYTIINDTESAAEDDIIGKGVISIISNDLEFVVGDRHFNIPEIVRKLPPIDMVDVTHYQYFPIEESKNILVMFEEPGNRYTAHFGEKPDSDRLLWNNESIKGLMSDLQDLTAKSSLSEAVASYEGIDIQSYQFSDWDYFVAQIGPIARVSVAVENTRTEEERDAVTDYDAILACIVARAILIALKKSGNNITLYNEHDLRSTNMALLAVDRSGS